MSKRVFSELPNDMVRRMRNWARWAAAGGVLGFSSCGMWSVVPSGPRGESSINTMGGEADDTERALNSLPIRYGQAVKLFWQYEGKSMAYLARRCGQGCDYRTFENRVIDGHALLRGEVARRSEAAQMQRERFEECTACHLTA